jgi:plastocyanin
MSTVAAAAVLASLLPAGAATKTVEIPARRFEPERLTIFVGDTVRWVNRDDIEHTVSANSSAQALGESFDSSPGNNCPGGILFGDNCLDPGESFSHRFTHAGTFTYRCKRHGSDTSFANCAMCGQVIVKTKSSPPPSKSPTTATPSVPVSPSTSVSPTLTTGVSPSGVLTSPVPGSAEDQPFPTIAVAGLALALLGTSGFFVWRTLIRR